MANKLYKYELHCHTGCVSRCGRVEPEEIVKLYIENGYDGIVVTDHYSPMTFTPNWRPQKQVDFYLSGYRRMKRAAEKLNPDFTVLLGMELRHYGTANDYLIYGVNEDFIYAAGNLMKPWEKKVYDMCHKNGFLHNIRHTQPCLFQDMLYILQGLAGLRFRTFSHHSGSCINRQLT